MSDPLQRFSTRVDNYVKYRPGYPSEILELLRRNCALTTDSVIADIGSGTGKLSELFLKNGNRVYGVEPNEAMRVSGEALLAHYPNFVSIPARAESTTLHSETIDLVTAGQAFHWFDREKTRREFTRILKPAGWVVLIWNERRLDSTSFLREYERLLLKYGTDYQVVRHENTTKGIAEFFMPGDLYVESFDNTQLLDWECLRGRVLSASYIPEAGAKNFETFLSKLREIFAANAANGKVAFEYDTRVYYGHLGSD